MCNPLLQPLGGTCVVHVRRIQQGDQDTDVQQGAHGLNAVGSAQAIDQIFADHGPARFKGYESCRCSYGRQALGTLRCSASRRRLAHQTRNDFAQAGVFCAHYFLGGDQGAAVQINNGAHGGPLSSL